MNVKQTILLITFALGVVSSYAQINITGIVRDSKSNKPVDFANVIVQNNSQTKLHTFTMTDSEGRFSFDYNENVDSLKITITAVNIKPQTLIISAKPQELTVFTVAKMMQVREVVVKADIPNVRKTGDTLTYFAAKYKDANDRVIEDVLRKMPGIDVQKSGKITYQGKAISKFYVEGMDMMGGRYSVASKNISVDDVMNVKVYENHQAIKALKNINIPDEAALDIKLKQTAKGSWTGSVQAGVGYEPWMWNVEAVAMYFGKKMQSLSTYKTNNTGDDVAKELGSQYGGISDAHSILGVQLPTTPPINENLYLNNNVHAVASNILLKLSENTQFKANISYSYDYQTSEGVSTTTHLLNGVAPIIVRELTYAAQKSDRINLYFNIETNKKKSYLSNSLHLKGDFNKDYGRVVSNDESVTQSFELPSFAVKNDLNLIVPLKNRFSLGVRSITEYNDAPSSLEIKPLLFPEIFDSPEGYPNAMQTLDSRRITSRNNVYTRFTWRRWSFALNAGFNAHVESLNSALSPMNEALAVAPTADSMRNNIDWQRYDLTVGPSVTYKLSDALNIRAYIYADFMSLTTKDKIQITNRSINTVIAAPSIKLNGRITQDLKYTASASYNEFYGGIYDSYRGFVMTDYRNISAKDGDIRHTKLQDYRASLSYANALNLIFVNLEGTYWKTDNNLTYSIDYSGALSYIKSVAIPNSSSGYGVAAKFSKQVLAISTVFKLSGGWSRSFSEIIRQDEMLDSRNDLATATFGSNTRFAKWLSFEYNADYTRSMGRVESIGDTEPIDYLTQRAELLFDFGKGVTATASGSHYYNNAIETADRDMFFLDAIISYRRKKVEYSLEGRNLLGAEVFNSAFTSDITAYVYSYNLRPRLVMLKVKVTL